VRKYAFLGLLTILSLFLITVPSSSQSSQELLEKMIDAQGGRKVLETIKDTTIQGDMEMIQYGMKGTIIRYQKEPNKTRMDMEMMGMTISQGYDGEKAWMVNPQTGTVEEMPERAAQEVKNEALGNDSLLNPEKYGIKYEAKGKEKIQDKEYYVLEQRLPDGTKASIYLDPQTFLVYKTKMKSVDFQTGAEILVEALFEDYQKSEGITAAHSMTIMHDGAEFLKMNFSKITYNANLDETRFRMPK
jgi:outer membrane lipoprotein-sorting protein